MPCSLKGSWKSAEAGVQFNITELKEGGEVDVPIRALNDQTGFFNQSSDWAVSVLIPFPKLSLMIVTAIHESTLHMATFSGNIKNNKTQKFHFEIYILQENVVFAMDENLSAVIGCW